MQNRTLVLLRHGQSIWNREERFTGRTDVPLTEQGLEEATAAGRLLASAGFTFDVAFTSELRRAQQTARNALAALNLGSIDLHFTWRLNERHFGILEGLQFTEAGRIHGPEWSQPWLWGLRPEGGESLDDVLERVRPFWEDELKPAIQSGRKVLVVSHGNTIRAVDELLRGGHGERLERVPTARPLRYDWDASGNLSRQMLFADPA